MLSDATKINDTDILIFIVNQLDESHRVLLRQKAPHLLELYSNHKYTYGNYRINNDYQTYDRYNGSYAQDEMGYSDDDIDTIFDGDPDAYWNID